MATSLRQSFRLEGADGGPLRGEVLAAPGATGPAVVICHGFKGFRDWGFFPQLADRLARAGITAVSFNFSGSGVSGALDDADEPERFARATYSNDLRDVEAVLAALEEGALVSGLGAPSRTGLFGHSRGGGTAVLAAARWAVSALVTWAAVARAFRWGPETVQQWRERGFIEIVNQRTGRVLELRTDVLDDLEVRGAELDILAAAERVTAPWLIVHGAVDESVPAEEAIELWEASGKRARLVTVPRGSHTFGARHPWAGMTPELEHAMEETVGWFSRWLY